MMQHDPDSTDEELEPIAVQPTHWEITSPTKPNLASCATFEKSKLEKPGVQPTSHQIEPVNPRVSSRRLRAPNPYGAGVMIHTVSSPEVDEMKQVKEELITETAKFRSKKN